MTEMMYVKVMWRTKICCTLQEQDKEKDDQKGNLSVSSIFFISHGEVSSNRKFRTLVRSKIMTESLALYTPPMRGSESPEISDNDVVNTTLRYFTHLTISSQICGTLFSFTVRTMGKLCTYGILKSNSNEDSNQDMLITSYRSSH